MSNDVFHVDRKISGTNVFEVAFKGQPDDRERQFVPRDFILIEQSNLEAFLAGCELSIGEIGAEHHVDLADVRDAEDVLTPVERAYDPYTGIPRMSDIPVNVRPYTGAVAD